MSVETDLIMATRFLSPASADSMFVHAYGAYVERSDAASLAGALLALMHAKDIEVRTLAAALKAATTERDQLRASHVPDFHEMMSTHGISVWQDPEWRGGRYGTPRWLAGQRVRAEEGTYYSELTGSGPASIEGDHIASGHSPSEAVWACVKGLPEAAAGGAS